MTPVSTISQTAGHWILWRGGGYLYH
jgi:hypothetical protein